MFPILAEFGNIKIYSYGFFIAIGYLSTLLSILYLGKKQKIHPQILVDATFYGLLFGLLGARLLFVITRLDYYTQYPLEIFYMWQGGFVFFGGLLTSIAYLIWLLKRHSLPQAKTLDIMTLALIPGHAFGRIGCLAAGCCHGGACDLPWAITINSSQVLESLRNIPIHPTQIYEATSLFLLTFILHLVHRKKSFHGQIALLYLMSYSVIRSIIEIYRGDLIRGFVVDSLISTSQFISILIFAYALTHYYILSKKNHRSLQSSQQ